MEATSPELSDEVADWLMAVEPRYSTVMSEVRLIRLWGCERPTEDVKKVAISRRWMARWNC